MTKPAKFVKIWTWVGRNFVFILFLNITSISCTSTIVLKLSPSDTTFELPEHGLKKGIYKLLSVNEENSSKNMVQNHRNYLVDLFRQSKDPYFSSDRWSQICLSKNQIGELQENSDGIYFLSDLTAAADLKVGFCTDSSVEVRYLVGQCKHDGLFYEITAVGEKAKNINFNCPDSLTLSQ